MVKKKNLGIFVGENGKWTFFHEIFAVLDRSFQTEIFTPKHYELPLLSGRLNRWAYHNRMQTMLRHNDLCFFEWASELLSAATHLPKTGPIVTRLHSYELTFWASRVNWDHVDRVILLTRAMESKFRAAYPDHAHKTAIINNGVDLKKFTPPANKPFQFNLGMVSNIHPIKRIYELVLTVHNLKKLGLNPHLHIAGGRWENAYFDDYYVAIQRAIEKLNLQDNVTQYGFVEDTPAWLQKIDIFISNSYWEGQQVALLEAMGCGCYCLAHFWDGVEEVLPAENIYVTENELIGKIIAFAEKPAAERQSCQAQLRSIAEQQFDITQTAAQICSFVDSTIHQAQKEQTPCVSAT